jgi:hypothetical protein
MKNYISLIITSILILSCVSLPNTSGENNIADQNIDVYDYLFKIFDKLPTNTNNLTFVEYKNGFFIIAAGQNIYYKLLNEDSPTFSPLHIYYKNFGNKEYQRGTSNSKYFNVNNIPVNWSITCTTPEIIFYYELQEGYRAIKNGAAGFTIVIDEMSFDYLFNIVELPFSKNASYDELIETIGFPVNDEDGIFNNWAHGIASHNRYETWRYLTYEQYPGLKVFIDEKDLFVTRISFDE